MKRTLLIRPAVSLLIVVLGFMWMGSAFAQQHRVLYASCMLLSEAQAR